MVGLDWVKGLAELYVQSVCDSSQWHQCNEKSKGQGSKSNTKDNYTTSNVASSILCLVTGRTGRLLEPQVDLLSIVGWCVFVLFSVVSIVEAFLLLSTDKF